MSKTFASKNTLRRVGLVVLVLILVTTGSVIRIRTVEESDTVDWLVVVQLGLSILAGVVGIMLMRKHSTGRTGAHLFMAYAAAAIVSGVFSSYLNLVVGYWLLLAGAGALCIGLVSSASDEATLARIEFVIFAALGAMVLKDSLLSWFVLDPIETDEVYRLGENTTSANALGVLAAMAFCMSFRSRARTNGLAAVRYFWRALFLLVVLLSRSRVGLMGLVAGMLIQFWYSQRRTAEPRRPVLVAAVPCGIGSIFMAGALAWIMGVQPVTAMVDLVNRSEDAATIMSVTGRTEIWAYAFQRIFDSLQTIVLGHGYGASRYVLNENNWAASFFAYHSHNTFLEAMLSTGLLGTVPFLLLLGYGASWLVRFSRLQNSFSTDFMLRAIAVLTLIFVSIFTESDLVSKIGPITIVFLFYVLSLDRQFAFRRANEQ